jgi:hypothetical protein
MSRKSVRNYSGEAIKSTELGMLKAFINELNTADSVFGNKVRLQLLENGSGNGNLGTYGVIKGAQSFMAAACKKGAHDLEDVGYQFEKLILFATGLGLGTVILGGTFSRGGFAKAMKLQEGETLPVVSPVGYEGGKKSLLGRLVKSNAGNRKPWGELFFDGNFGAPLSSGDDFAEVLEAVRQAPSAMNAQPWRIVKDDGGFHFYSAGTVDMNRIDMGIALCHFEIAAAEKGFAGNFRDLGRPGEENLRYLVSWLRD